MMTPPTDTLSYKANKISIVDSYLRQRVGRGRHKEKRRGVGVQERAKTGGDGMVVVGLHVTIHSKNSNLLHRRCGKSVNEITLKIQRSQHVTDT